ncbi:MAG: sodium:proton antiporter [Planctomycetaceae bacterium]|nr:sodium:proton antiporter [Planctomycetaceae bacterium]
MPITKSQIIDQLRTVNDPELHRDLVTLNMVKHVAVCDGHVTVAIELTTPACPLKDQIAQEVEAAVRSLGDEIQKVEIEWSARPQPPQHPHAHADQNESPQAQARQNNPLPGVKHMIAVGAGKGGVGKSTVAVNLAIALARAGHAVGLLDGDIYGPSIPTLLGLHDHQIQGTNELFYPFNVHGIKSMTIGKIVDPDNALIWRGPMAHGAFQQLATKTDWGDLDYLIIDLPPGTGDVPLTLAQMLPLTGAVIVCTPQKVAQDDARRAVRMFEKLDVPLLGIIENMSYFIGDDDKEYDIFGRGGAAQLAEFLNLPLLGTIPIHMELRANGDAGDPTQNFEGNPTLADELNTLAQTVERVISQHEVAGEARQPTLNIS